MKALKYLSIVLAGLFLFAACQKEYSVEGGNGGIAAGSLKSVAGDCLPVSVFGVYIQDSTLKDSNTVVVQVNFTSAGSYNIYTDTANGFSFKDSGFMSNTGLQNITLKASGKPLLSQSTNFTVVFDTSFCSFTVNVVGKTPAVYSLSGSPDKCSSFDVRGSYQNGTALSSGNQVILQVDVTTIGGYSINTGPVGGMTFAGSGNFTTTGTQNITLQGSGTPTTTGTNTFAVNAGSSNCSFDVTVAAATGGNTDPNSSDSAWQFTGDNLNAGPFYDVFDTTRSGAYGLVFLGSTPAGDTAIQMGILFSTGTIQPGTYSTRAFAGFYFTDYRDTANPVDIYIADPNSFTSGGVEIKITIASYDAATGIITGTFAGTALNSSNTPVPISGGKFRAKVRHT